MPDTVEHESPAKKNDGEQGQEAYPFCKKRCDSPTECQSNLRKNNWSLTSEILSESTPRVQHINPNCVRRTPIQSDSRVSTLLRQFFLHETVQTHSASCQKRPHLSTSLWVNRMSQLKNNQQTSRMKFGPDTGDLLQEIALHEQLTEKSALPLWSSTYSAPNQIDQLVQD